MLLHCIHDLARAHWRNQYDLQCVCNISTNTPRAALSPHLFAPSHHARTFPLPHCHHHGTQTCHTHRACRAPRPQTGTHALAQPHTACPCHTAAKVQHELARDQRRQRTQQQPGPEQEGPEQEGPEQEDEWTDGASDAFSNSADPLSQLAEVAVEAAEAEARMQRKQAMVPAAPAALKPAPLMPALHLGQPVQPAEKQNSMEASAECFTASPASAGHITAHSPHSRRRSMHLPAAAPQLGCPAARVQPAIKVQEDEAHDAYEKLVLMQLKQKLLACIGIDGLQRAPQQTKGPHAAAPAPRAAVHALAKLWPAVHPGRQWHAPQEVAAHTEGHGQNNRSSSSGSHMPAQRVWHSAAGAQRMQPHVTPPQQPQQPGAAGPACSGEARMSDQQVGQALQTMEWHLQEFRRLRRDVLAARPGARLTASIGETPRSAGPAAHANTIRPAAGWPDAREQQHAMLRHQAASAAVARGPAAVAEQATRRDRLHPAAPPRSGMGSELAYLQPVQAGRQAGHGWGQGMPLNEGPVPPQAQYHMPEHRPEVQYHTVPEYARPGAYQYPAPMHHAGRQAGVPLAVPLQAGY